MQLLLATATVNAQTNNGCRYHWTGLQITPLNANNHEGAVFYDVKYPNKESCGVTYVALQHTFPFKVFITLRLQVIDWHGKTSIVEYGGEMNPNIHYTDPGNFDNFKQVNEVVGVRVTYKKGDDFYEIIYDREKGINETLINGKTAEQISAEKKAAIEQKQKSYQNQLKNLDDRQDKLKARADTLRGGDQSNIEALQNEYDQTEIDISDILNNAGKNQQLTDADVSNINQKINRLRNINTELDREIDKVESDNELAERKEKEEERKQEKTQQDSAQSNTASTTSYPGTEHDLQMQQRANTQRQKDAAENATAAAAGTVIATGMGVMMKHNIDNDNEDDHTDYYLKGNLGLGFASIPINDNMIYNGSTNKTISTTTIPLMATASFLFSAFNDKLIRLSASPSVSYGLLALNEGHSGHFLSYGGGATIGIGGAFRVLLKGIYEKRQGVETEDDAGIGIDATGSADYNYATLKYGPGLYYSFGLHDCFAELSAYRENLSFLKDVKGAAVYSYQLRLSFMALAFDIQYAPNYPIAGVLKYPSAYSKSKQNLLILSLSVPITIASE